MFGLEALFKPKEPPKFTKEELEEKYKLEDEFDELMYELNCYNKSEQTAYMELTDKMQFGWKGELILVPNVPFSKIMQNIDVVQECMACLFIIETKPFIKKATIYLMNKPIDSSIKYVPPKTKPNELFFGLSFDLEPIVIDCYKDLHFLIGGTTGSGKTRMLWAMITTIMVNTTLQEAEIFLVDIAKDEFSIFSQEKHVKFYSNSIDKLKTMLLYLESRYQNRKAKFSSLRDSGGASGIEEYNAANPDNPMSMIYIFVDELSLITPDNTDLKQEKNEKAFCLDYIKRLAKLGRQFGFIVLNGIQKTTREEMPSILKNMSSVRLSMRANDRVSSETIIGNNAAVGLPKRIGIYSTNGGETQHFTFSPSIDAGMIKALISKNEDKKYRQNKEAEITRFVKELSFDQPDKETRHVKKLKDVSWSQKQKAPTTELHLVKASDDEEDGPLEDI